MRGRRVLWKQIGEREKGQSRNSGRKGLEVIMAFRLGRSAKEGDSTFGADGEDDQEK
jgi:hypothetical protein